MDFLDEELEALQSAGRRREPRVISQRQGARVTVDGQTLINVSSNDYLGLATHPALVAAATAAMVEGGVGAGASRLVTGNVALAAALESELAAFHGLPAARLFNSGYAANAGIIPVLVEKGDVVFSDELNHASIIDGCRLSRAMVQVYRHRDVGHLAELLERHGGRRRLVVTESLFSMDGDLAPLADLRALSAAQGAMLMVDDAHAVGAIGDGRGLGTAAGADLVVGTLGKAFGAAGAYVLGSRALADLLWNRARSLVFSTGLAVPVLAAARAALALIASEEGAARRARLRQIEERIGRGGYIIPLIVGDDRRAMEAMRWLQEAGVLIQAIRPPTVREGTARLRLSLTSGLTDPDVAVVSRLVREMDDAGWFVPRGTPG